MLQNRHMGRQQLVPRIKRGATAIKIYFSQIVEPDPKILLNPQQAQSSSFPFGLSLICLQIIICLLTLDHADHG